MGFKEKETTYKTAKKFAAALVRRVNGHHALTARGQDFMGLVQAQTVLQNHVDSKKDFASPGEGYNEALEQRMGELSKKLGVDPQDTQFRAEVLEFLAGKDIYPWRFNQH